MIDTERIATPTEPSDEWGPLIRPGAAESFFNLADPPPLRKTTALDLVNTWWAAECSRIMYRSAFTTGWSPPRSAFLDAVGWMEFAAVRAAGMEWAIMGPAPTGDANVDEAAPVMLVFRGSAGAPNWVSNFTAVPSSWIRGGQVHQGFADLLERLWPEVEAALDELPGRAICVAGHSLGGALALLAGDRLAMQSRARAGVYTFGAPRVGDPTFAEVRRTGVHRVVNHRDIVADVPPKTGPMRFRHAGQLVYIDQHGVVHPRPDVHLAAHDRAATWPPAWRLDSLILRKPPRALADHAPINYVAHLEAWVRASHAPPPEST